MKNPFLPKINEQSMLNFLVNHDSYFADTFDKEIINKMVNNINCDFPLLLNTGVIILSEDERELVKEALTRLSKDINILSSINGFNTSVIDKINLILKRI